jgi:hypothetical protein
MNKYIHRGQKKKTIVFVKLKKNEKDFEIRDHYLTRINVLESSDGAVRIATSYGLGDGGAEFRDMVG